MEHWLRARHCACTGVSELQNTENMVLALEELKAVVQTRRMSDPRDSSQCYDSNMDRVEEAWVQVIEVGIPSTDI